MLVYRASLVAMPYLPVAEAITQPHRRRWRQVASKLIREVRNIVQIELRANIDVIRHEELDAQAGVNLKMIRVQYRLALRTANGDTRAILGEREAGLGAAQA